jgi:uncharacterized protein YggL (DUF469 family)
MSAACPVFGFVVEFRIQPGLDDAAEMALWDSFIGDAIEARGLMCGGGATGRQWSRVVRSEAGQATDADREAVISWSRARPEIVATTVGPLTYLKDDD